MSKKLGNINREDCGGSFAGNVYDPEDLAPTIRALSGGGLEPIIIEVKKEKEDEQRK